MSSRSSKTTNEQFSTMIDFLEEHSMMISNRSKKVSEKYIKMLNDLWDDLTLLLNNSVKGAVKSRSQWKKTFSDWKYINKKKYATLHADGKINKDGEVTGPYLTPSEDRLLRLLIQAEGSKYVLSNSNENNNESRTIYVKEEDSDESDTHIDIGQEKNSKRLAEKQGNYKLKRPHHDISNGIPDDDFTDVAIEGSNKIEIKLREKELNIYVQSYKTY
ncbi:unnamed protein product [Brassicogethes aeneus]|uniref:Regulatory protein zeste n=1 Tax=Brassicogethes aeneus TaxID=1431903 RepID=A0A9P0BCU3_BRAAE|nr:unnamed protein product [Brassicogethes aeneus]